MTPRRRRDDYEHLSDRELLLQIVVDLAPIPGLVKDVGSLKRWREQLRGGFKFAGLIGATIVGLAVVVTAGASVFHG